MKRKGKSERKVFVKTTRGNKVKYVGKNPDSDVCSECNENLKGIPRTKVSKIGNTPKSKKRVNRKYGGNLCNKCSRKKIISEARQWKSDN
jgi:large subunit ribosomal protein L34e